MSIGLSESTLPLADLIAKHSSELAGVLHGKGTFIAGSAPRVSAYGRHTVLMKVTLGVGGSRARSGLCGEGLFGRIQVTYGNCGAH